MDGDRLRLPANRNFYRLSRVSWALLILLVMVDYRAQSVQSVSCHVLALLAHSYSIALFAYTVHLYVEFTMYLKLICMKTLVACDLKLHRIWPLCLCIWEFCDTACLFTDPVWYNFVSLFTAVNLIWLFAVLSMLLVGGIKFISVVL